MLSWRFVYKLFAAVALRSDLLAAWWPVDLGDIGCVSLATDCQIAKAAATPTLLAAKQTTDFT